MCKFRNKIVLTWPYNMSQGWIQDFKLGGGGGALKFYLGVFRVENHDFTPKNHIFSHFRGGGAPGAPPGSAPVS